jgi:hypothetical protein
MVIAAVTDLMTGLFFNPNVESLARLEQVAPAASALPASDIIAVSATTDPKSPIDILELAINVLPDLLGRSA